MKHRHLKTQQLSLPALDDIIGRGDLSEWIELRDAIHANRSVAQNILKICKPHLTDETQQRYHLWKYYAERQLA